MSEPLSASRRAPLALYLHWPYCARICPYCDFNVYRHRAVDTHAWRAAFLRDFDYFAAQTGPRALSSIYFGGGTPSLMAPALVADIIDAAASRWTLTEGVEITLEANPTDAEISRFQDFARAGVNRLSLGVQRFDDPSLQFLGRNHDASLARKALERAVEVFRDVSFDRIYGLPEETPALWRETLEPALAYGANHLSLYQLTIEQGTAFARAAARGAFTPIPDDREADFYEIADEMTRARGLPAYETSNHARPGAQSRHNIVYWRGGDYLGVGPGAHGRLTETRAHGRLTETLARRAIEAVRAPAAYLGARDAAAIYASELLTSEEIFIERLAMGLRLVEGVSLAEADWRALAPRLERLDPDRYDVEEEASGVRLRLKGEGRFLLNAIVRELIA